jgi:glycerate kinase
VDSFFGLPADGETGVVEMAAASGLTLVLPDRRNPLLATSRGTGELIRAALDSGVRRLIVGIGGSATNDGGAGMLAALGARFLDADGAAFVPVGGTLAHIDTVDLSNLDPRLAGIDIRVACDVTNPLCGPTGASAVYGPQKGATPAMVAELDRALAHFADILAATTGHDLRDTPGAGAAGGLGFALMAVLHADMQPGVRIVAEAAGLEARIARADLVLTGEGRTDAQTACGKAPAGVAAIAARHGVPVVCLSGSLGEGVDLLYAQGITALFSIADGPMTLEEAMAHASALLERAAENTIRLYLAPERRRARG